MTEYIYEIAKIILLSIIVIILIFIFAAVRTQNLYLAVLKDAEIEFGLQQEDYAQEK